MPNSPRTQPSNSHRSAGTRNKDHLKSDRDATMSANPAAQQDQYGSRHNADHIKREQRRTSAPAGSSDLAFRESAQDSSPVRGAKNRVAGRRSKPKARKAAAKSKR